MKAGAKQSHHVVVGNLADALRPGAKLAGCSTTSRDTAVVTAKSSVRYPDIVDGGPSDLDAMAATQPTILAKVLSPGKRSTTRSRRKTDPSLSLVEAPG